VSSVDVKELKAFAGKLDFLLVTVGASLEWDALLGTLAPKGRMHMVGVVTEAMKLRTGSLLSWQRSISASPTPSPVTLMKMMDFCARHGIAPQVEHFPMSRVNDAVAHLRSGNARYRVVLDADFA